jgi:hypothetical protein
MRCGKRMVDPRAGQTNIGSAPDPRWKPKRPNLVRELLRILEASL